LPFKRKKFEKSCLNVNFTKFANLFLNRQNYQKPLWKCFNLLSSFTTRSIKLTLNAHKWALKLLNHAKLRTKYVRREWASPNERNGEQTCFCTILLHNQFDLQLLCFCMKAWHSLEKNLFILNFVKKNLCAYAKGNSVHEGSGERDKFVVLQELKNKL